MPQPEIFTLLIEFFEEDNWDFHWIEDTPILSMGYQGRNGKWICYAQARETQQQVVFYSVLPVNAPDDRRSAVAEFITRANYGMIIGNFELDYEDGEIRYKTSMDLEGFDLIPSMIRQLVYANLIITDRYLPGIMRVIYSSASPAEVLEQIEIEDGSEDPEDLDDDFLEDYDDDFDEPDDPDTSLLN